MLRLKSKTQSAITIGPDIAIVFFGDFKGWIDLGIHAPAGLRITRLGPWTPEQMAEKLAALRLINGKIVEAKS